MELKLPNFKPRECDPQFRECELFVRYDADGCLVNLAGTFIILSDG